jgi:hypothetical protein
MAGQKEFEAFVFELKHTHGVATAEKYQRLFSLAQSKQPCDVRTTDGALYLNARIGADFVYAFQFEAEQDDLLTFLNSVKIVSEDVFQPVTAVPIDDIVALVRLPKTKLTSRDLKAIDCSKARGARLPSGQPLTEFIDDVYSPATSKEALHYLRRYMAAERKLKNG